MSPTDDQRAFASAVAEKFTEDVHPQLENWLLLSIAPLEHSEEERQEAGRELIRACHTRSVSEGNSTNSLVSVTFGYVAGAMQAWRFLSSDAPLEPESGFDALQRQIEDLPELNETRILHENAQHALLRQIAKRAGEVTDVGELRILADAYLTLPAPDEDEAS